MNEQIEDSLVENYEHLIPTLELPDPDDRHVLATAIHAEAKVIVTCNLRDFPIDALGQYDIRAISPDAFFVELFADKPAPILKALAE